MMWTTDAQQPSTSTKVDELPCFDSSVACIEQLTTRAVKNSRELQVIGQAITLQRRKLWTTYLSANALNPLSFGLQLAQNIAGGGARAEGKLTLAQFELRRAEVGRALHDSISALVAIIEAAQLKEKLSSAALQTHTARVGILEVGYEFGEGDTAAMLPLWQRTDELKAEIEAARDEQVRTRRKLTQLVNTPPRVTGGY